MGGFQLNGVSRFQKFTSEANILICKKVISKGGGEKQKERSGENGLSEKDVLIHKSPGL